ncbi:MAG: carboxypeptidase-like regulatory domain-containing protein [Ginsengibacter sp.]
MRVLVNKMLLSIGIPQLFLFLFYPSSPLPAQTLQTKFNGIVTDPEGAPLVGVTVTLKGTQQKTITSTSGSFGIDAEERRCYNIELCWLQGSMSRYK